MICSGLGFCYNESDYGNGPFYHRIFYYLLKKYQNSSDLNNYFSRSNRIPYNPHPISLLVNRFY